jgi:uncharacterized membrane protein YdjX (TVP38/TMEM64 family)
MKTGKILILIALTGAVALVFLFLPVGEWIMRFESYVRSLGAVAPVIMALAYVICTVLFIPGSALTLATVTIFGPAAGFVIVFIGANLGALGAFLLARTFLRRRVACWAEANRKFRSLDRAIGRHGFKIVLLARLSPIFPFNTLNYLFGVTPIETGAYVFGTLMGMLPGMFLYIYIGAAAKDALVGGVGPSAEPFQQSLKYAGLLATIAFVFVMARLARKALLEAEEKSVRPLSSLPRGGGDVRGGS